MLLCLVHKSAAAAACWLLFCQPAYLHVAAENTMWYPMPVVDLLTLASAACTLMTMQLGSMTLMKLGGRSSMVRALATKARDLGWVPSDYCLFFSLNVVSLYYKIYFPTSIG